jgi:hypothetical protein
VESTTVKGGGDEKSSQTFYEICMDAGGPLLGSGTGESADLREELAFLKQTSQHGFRFETRIRARDLARWVRHSRTAPDEWIDLRIKVRMLSDQ